MAMNIRNSLLAGAACLLALPAQATDTKGGYMILGPGANSCERVITDLANDAKNNNPASVIVYSNWLAGSLTAYNRDTKGTYSVTGSNDFDDVFKSTLQYCQQNPETIYAGAVDATIARLKLHHPIAVAAPVPEERPVEDTPIARPPVETMQRPAPTRAVDEWRDDDTPVKKPVPARQAPAPVRAVDEWRDDDIPVKKPAPARHAPAPVKVINDWQDDEAPARKPIVTQDPAPIIMDNWNDNDDIKPVKKPVQRKPAKKVVPDEDNGMEDDQGGKTLHYRMDE